MDSTSLQMMARLFAGARHAVVLTGAGISTPSGIPDFRSPRVGLWENVNSEEVASIDGFRRDPRAFYDWLRPLVGLVRRAQPNPAHLALAALEKAGKVHAVVTQNIDGLHQRAGSQRVLEVHGHLRTARCLQCAREWPTDSLWAGFEQGGDLLRCPECNGMLKPSVVLYGEMLPRDILLQAEEEARQCDLFCVVGSSLTVAPASLLPAKAARHGARVIIVNRTATELDGLAMAISREDVAVALPAIAEGCGVRL